MSARAASPPPSPLSLFAARRSSILRAASAIAALSTSSGSAGARRSSSSSSSSTALRRAWTLSPRAAWYRSVDFFRTNEYLLALASILVPSRKQVSSVMCPASARTETTSEKTSSKTGRILSLRKRLTVLCERGRMPVSHMKQMFSEAARAIRRLE